MFWFRKCIFIDILVKLVFMGAIHNEPPVGQIGNDLSPNRPEAVNWTKDGLDTDVYMS